MFWILIAGVAVISVKYYTALGARNLERRLNKVKAGLEEARRRLKAEREQEAGIAAEEELAELRLRYMKELIEDIRIRLTGSDERRIAEDSEEEIAGPAIRF